jgi:hypothetical protein|tara:strand:+ start:177 stop:320 length:144 start_codon:yes stop_codon:yes gene_type:complete
MGTNARVVNRKSGFSSRRRRDGASFDADAREMRLDDAVSVLVLFFWY